MDFALLSKYDDLFTDIFLDALFLWFSTVKMNTDHRRPRIPTSKVLDIIQRNVLEKAKLNDAVQEFLNLEWFKGYLANKTPKQHQEFVQHMKRYLSMYLPNAGYEISETKRYSTSKRTEACVIATKDWSVGDELRLCTGAIACLNPKEDAELKQGQRDFSVMYSTRKGCSCLFLGPARFFNHDCNSNCKFIASGQNGITFKFIKDVKCGDELTTYYGMHYFGENNCECRCVTCERNGQGAFATEADQEQSTTESTENTNRRSGRKRKSANYEEYAVQSPKRSRAPSTPLGSRDSSATLSDLSDSDFETDKRPFEDVKGPNDGQDNIKVEPLSPTVHNQPLVMSIGFLCSEEEKAKKEAAAATLAAVNPKPDMHRTLGHQRVHSGSPLDLLCDAIMDVEFLQAQSERVAATTTTGANVTRLEDPLAKPEPKSEAMQDIDSFEDSLFDDVLSNFDEFDDGISDLSSIDSDLLSDESDADTPPSSVSSNERPFISRAPDHKMAFQQQRRRGSKQELRCLACDKPLVQSKESSDPADPVATELATWTWSPSAVFIDWCPKRCPRCERHFSIFKQEWPKRKIKVKRVHKDQHAVSVAFNDDAKETVEQVEEEDEMDVTPILATRIDKPITFSRRHRPQKPVIHTGMLDTVSALRQVFGENDI